MICATSLQSERSKSLASLEDEPGPNNGWLHLYIAWKLRRFSSRYRNWQQLQFMVTGPLLWFVTWHLALSASEESELESSAGTSSGSCTSSHHTSLALWTDDAGLSPGSLSVCKQIWSTVTTPGEICILWPNQWQGSAGQLLIQQDLWQVHNGPWYSVPSLSWGVRGQDSKECRSHKLCWWPILAFSTAPQEVSQGTFQCMDCGGITPQPGVWFLSKEEAVLSQIPYQGHVQSQLPQDNGCCPWRYCYCSEKGGFKAFVWMGNFVCLMMLIPVLTFVNGDAKSGDTLVSGFGGKNCIARVPRMCLCVKADLDNPLYRCLWICMAYQRALNEKVAQLLVPLETCQDKPPESCHQRRAISHQHFCLLAKWVPQSGDWQNHVWCLPMVGNPQRDQCQQQQECWQNFVHERPYQPGAEAHVPCNPRHFPPASQWT